MVGKKSKKIRAGVSPLFGQCLKETFFFIGVHLFVTPNTIFQVNQNSDFDDPVTLTL